jgi:hypothetical protein
LVQYYTDFVCSIRQPPWYMSSVSVTLALFRAFTRWLYVCANTASLNIQTSRVSHYNMKSRSKCTVKSFRGSCTSLNCLGRKVTCSSHQAGQWRSGLLATPINLQPKCTANRTYPYYSRYWRCSLLFQYIMHKLNLQ